YGEAMTGDTVYARDYIRPEYEGETYDYVGSYELYKTQTAEVVEFEGMGETHTYYWDAYMTEAGQWDDYALDALTLGDWWTEEYEQGLVLVYVLEEEQPEAVPKAGGFEPAPNTGDHSGAGLWLALLLSAAGCAGALAVRKKRG
ncbi:MAG: LPXTG cell wall anchor domain-containing protein, partial [Eubacterium sp.]|nr:LPXTG cell wall anchor domain-containing protein [Eubacterium sp.]